MPTFSYAQAAKGLAPAPTKATVAESDKVDSKSEDQSNTPFTTDASSTTSEPSVPRDIEKETTDVANDSEFTTVTSKLSAAKAKAANSRTSSPNASNSANGTHRKKDDASNVTNGTSEAASGKQSQSDKQAEKPENGGTEGSKDKSGDSESSAPPKELKAAPIPTVNIWQQRKEAQDAKTKATPPVPAAKAGSTKSATAEDSQQDLAKPNQKKKADGASDGAKDRKKADGKSRDDGSAMPPVADATLWPTPQVALGEEKKKAQEKTDKSEQTNKSPVMRTHGKEKWTPVPYVPTAVFNTPLPSASGRRGGGPKASRGGREGGRGGSHAAGEKAAAGQGAAGSAPKQTSGGERGRLEPSTGRATSLPAQSRRSTSTDVLPAGGKTSQPADKSRGARSGEDSTAATGKQANGGENVSRPQREGKPFARNQASGDRNARGTHLAVDSQAAPRANERRLENGSKSADFYRESGLDYNRERGDPRAERGGRGSNRGRGGYPAFGGQNAQFANAAPMPNNSFATPKAFGFNERQRSQQGLPNGAQQQGNRMPLRSPSLPTTPGMYGVFPFDVNSMYGYQPANPGAMNAMPYQQQYMEPFSLMNMLSMQLEYYFSVDNMCKDMFLRRHMDGQGFVPLGVIASFKRVKSLTEDFELLRVVSRQLRNVEHQVGDDGVDRLRPRERWAQWILPVDQRDPSAQHEGAPPAKQIGKTDENVPFNHHADGAPNGYGGPRQFVPNGTASRGPKTSLSTAAPEFMPSGPPSAHNEIANVGTPSDPSCFQQDCDSALSTPLDTLDDSFIDAFIPARGLELHTDCPSSPSLGPTVDSPGPISTLTDIPSKNESHPPSEKRPDHQSKNARKSSAKGVQKFRKPQSRKAEKKASGVGLPYHSWARYLAHSFDLQLYNDFRRLALDELISRHADYGFNALLSFYQSCLLSQQSINERVVQDMAHLARSNGTGRIAEPMLSAVLVAINSDRMTPGNRSLTGYYFNVQFGHGDWQK
ncbi:Winged helix-turn-helix transcription repressor DNA-binding [Penicillium lagena]|uniref:Winged helix-turn-helix transcription repressor DNA-binding n=1 Tax=Penicillium lagena TaxID=94218 RepID=UPI0025416A60|nr:Winged helix-turn-helix transcription repressor DNA-binding [Penicillium lagena]KAJ5610875.1 Winged helix-turn-helix transcription repressor DNA-binding [Penicillium lagena]